MVMVGYLTTGLRRSTPSAVEGRASGAGFDKLSHPSIPQDDEPYAVEEHGND